jgi:hypothetical protein
LIQGVVSTDEAIAMVFDHWRNPSRTDSVCRLPELAGGDDEPIVDVSFQLSTDSARRS